MPEYKCITRCYGLHNRMWEIGEKVTEDKKNMPKDEKGNVAYFKEILPKPKRAKMPEENISVKANIDHRQIVEFDKPLNSMTKNELLALAKQLGMNLDPTIHHFTMRSMISKRLNGETR